MTALAFSECAQPRQRTRSAISESGNMVAARVEHLANREPTLGCLGERAAAFSELVELKIEHSKKGWDGCEAPPISDSALANAYHFLKSLPRSIPNPEFAVDPDDGSIGLEWYGGRKRIFSVSIGESSRLPCAYIDGSSRGNMVENFDGLLISPALMTRILSIVS
jgi:hypothetical protein